jgi:hypothetical protein
MTYNDPRHWLDQLPVYSRARTASAEITILRDDMLEGGSKLRVVPFAVGDAAEVVFGGPFCGGAPHALSVWGRDAGRRVTLFFAKRDKLHARQEAARRNGARLEFVSPGYMTVVQKRARDYAERAGALFLPLGLDVEGARSAMIEFASGVRAQLGTPDQVWCATGSGMLAQVLAAAFPDAEVCATAVGLPSRHDAQRYPSNVRMTEAGVPFDRNVSVAAPFPICGHYEAKAWRRCAAEAKGKVLFWNVAAPSPPALK